MASAGCAALAAGLWLAGCNAPPPERTARPVVERNAELRMQHLHVVIAHALDMIARAGNLQLDGDPAGRRMLDDAERLLDRALGGAVMAEMHRKGLDQAPLMRAAHALGREMRQLIAAARGLRADAPERDALRALNRALGMAAAANGLMMVGQSGQGGDIDALMVNHGQRMLGEAMALFHASEVADPAWRAWRARIGRVIARLAGMPEEAL